MTFDPVQMRKLAQTKADENWRFRHFLKTRCDLEREEIDKQVFEIAQCVWSGIDCTACANCCRQVQPSFSDADVGRLAHRLEMDRQQFIENYLKPTEALNANPWQTRTTPCPFLKDNRCSVYEDRPADCRGYPYLHQPDFLSRTMGMIGRTFTCPIVYEVLEELKGSFEFSRRKRR